MQASSSTTPSRLNPTRARNLLALIFALILTLLFAASHATAAVHAKSRSHAAASSKVRAHKQAAVNRRSKNHSHKVDVKKGSKKASRKRPTSSSSTTSTQSTIQPADNSTTTTTTNTGTSATTTGAASFSSAVTGSTSPSGSVLFDGSAVSAWYNQSASPTRIQIVPDPDGQGDPVQQFTTLNTDVKPLTPTINPRSQLTAPQTIVKQGNSYWESFEVYIPTSLTLPKTGWVALGAVVYGRPYTASPPAGISINNGAFRFQMNGYGPNPWQIAWTTPVVKGQWYRFTWHYLLATNGWIQLYVDDKLQNLKYGSSTVTTMPIALIDPGDAQGPWGPQEQLYYQLNTFPSASIYFKGFKIGTTQAAAES